MRLSPLAWLAATFVAGMVQAAPCAPPREVREATPDEVRQWVAAQKREVIGFYGYSGAQYQDAAAMLAMAERTLKAADPKRTMVLIGATADGIGAVYEVARRLGFTTLGIVSTQAQGAPGVRLSDCVDVVFYVRDALWGGYQPGTTTLSPTSAAMVGASTRLVAIGGGEIVRDELLAARAMGKRIRFHPADFHHGLAREKAMRSGTPPPADFRGAAHAVFGPKR